MKRTILYLSLLTLLLLPEAAVAKPVSQTSVMQIFLLLFASGVVGVGAAVFGVHAAWRYGRSRSLKARLAQPRNATRIHGVAGVSFQPRPEPEPSKVTYLAARRGAKSATRRWQEPEPGYGRGIHRPF